MMTIPELLVLVIPVVMLGLVTAYLIYERESLVIQNKAKEDKLLEENSRLVKALISKNAHDYVMTTSIDKVPTEEKPPENPDEVPEETVSDDEFFKAIGKSLKE